MGPFIQVTVLARGKSGVTQLRRHRNERPGRVTEPPHEAPAAGSATPASEPVAPITVQRRRRQASAPQDQAMYTCECGFVFEAQVSTSVGCPHCGGPQAW